jgi:hypothetical protein
MPVPVGYHRIGHESDVLRTLHVLARTAAAPADPGAELEHETDVQHALVVALAAAVRYGTIVADRPADTPV